MTPRRRLGVRAAVLVLLASAGPNLAGARGADAGNQAEAWYGSAPGLSCTAPAGCPPASPPSPPVFPADTLHVGMTAGFEVARTYLHPDLSSIDLAQPPAAATMTLPILDDPGAGGVNAANASIAACLVTESWEDGAAGSSERPPETDCATNSAAKFSAATNTFTVDLLPFISAWRNAAPPLGIALVPALGASPDPAATWRVVFSGRKRSGGTPIRSQFAAPVQQAASATSDTDLESLAPTEPLLDILAPSFAGWDTAAATAFATDASTPAPERIVVGTAAADLPPGHPNRFALALFLPLLLIIGALHLASVFTSDPLAAPGARTRRLSR